MQPSPSKPSMSWPEVTVCLALFALVAFIVWVLAS